jgi:hypothetical protein
MISTRPGSFAALACREIARYPGELSDRPIRMGRILVCSPVEVGIRPPSRWAERLRAAGLLRPALVRVMPHAAALRDGRPRWSYLDGQERAVVIRLLDADDGLSVSALGDGDPSGALERTLADLYRGGYLSPPAGLWVTNAGLALGITP